MIPVEYDWDLNPKTVHNTSSPHHGVLSMCIFKKIGFVKTTPHCIILIMYRFKKQKKEARESKKQ